MKLCEIKKKFYYYFFTSLDSNNPDAASAVFRTTVKTDRYNSKMQDLLDHSMDGRPMELRSLHVDSKNFKKNPYSDEQLIKVGVIYFAKRDGEIRYKKLSLNSHEQELKLKLTFDDLIPLAYNDRNGKPVKAHVVQVFGA